MIFTKPKLIAGIAAAVALAGLIAVVRVQAARLDAVTAQRDTAREQLVQMSAQVAEQQAYRVRLEDAITERERQLTRISLQLRKTRDELHKISSEVSDEKWQECRVVVVPDALIELLRTAAADNN